VWRRHADRPLPSHHALCTTCIQLLPLVEMYCKWELEEDCSDLRTLMLRFDYETDLQSHELGRSLLSMLHDDNLGVHNFPHQLDIASPVDPFELFRERLATAGTAIRGLQQQVSMLACFFHTSMPNTDNSNTL
jgi:hypothetical protein